MRVFIENEAGFATKNLFDQRTLTHLGATQVSLPYPYPYGFVIGTVGGDGDAVDCFVLTKSMHASGDTIECEPLGLIEQVEDGEIDHKVLAIPVHEIRVIDEAIIGELKDFIRGVFAHVPGKQVEIGRQLSSTEARAYIEACREESPPSGQTGT